MDSFRMLEFGAEEKEPEFEFLFRLVFLPRITIFIRFA